ncbi:MAG: hypothetical protein AAF928_07335 [Myxococcota bacterium]
MTPRQLMAVGASMFLVPLVAGIDEAEVWLSTTTAAVVLVVSGAFRRTQVPEGTSSAAAE